MGSTRRQFLLGAMAAPALCASDADREPVQVLSVPQNGIQPQLIVGGNTIHLIYFAGTPKNGDIFYRRSQDLGRTFSPPIRVNSQEGSAIAIGTIRGAQISLGKQDRAHVAWSGSDIAEPRAPLNPAAGKP